MLPIDKKWPNSDTIKTEHEMFRGDLIDFELLSLCLNGLNEFEGDF
jgi:hypothetical protein